MVLPVAVAAAVPRLAAVAEEMVVEEVEVAAVVLVADVEVVGVDATRDVYLV